MYDPGGTSLTRVMRPCSQGSDAHVSRHVGVPEDLVKPHAQQHFCEVTPASRASARLNGSRGSNAFRFCAGTNMTHDPECSRTPRRSSPTQSRGKPLRPTSQIDASRLKTANDVFSSRQRHSLAVSRRPTRISASGMSAQDHSGAVSERMSIRQPVSRAASRAFWPSRPMARDS